MYNYFDKRIFITASLGSTHDGNVSLAKKMMALAKRSKVDAVKFQKRNVEKYPDTEYISDIFGKTTLKDYRKSLEFGKEEYDKIDLFAKELGIIWYVSLYDLESLEFMEKNYNLSIYKIPSCKINDLKFISSVAKLKKLTFMSTGMSTMYEVDRAVTTFLAYNKNLVLMHTTSIYPALYGDVNLRIMRTLHKHYGLHTGYDSHDMGNHISLAAVGMGAKAIEKHMTLNRGILKGHNHTIASEPYELEMLVNNIRDIEKSFGRAHRKLMSREIDNRVIETGETVSDLLKLEGGCLC